MAVPGLQLSEVDDAIDTGPSVQSIYLQSQNEWRFEVGFDASIDIKLTRGTAELFGTELPLSKTFTFTGTKGAIFTWSGCEFAVTGTPSVEYTSEETLMPIYANLHFALEKQRGEAGGSGQQGPRVMIVGPADAGKTSLVKMLTGYAVRQGGAPLVVNLDPKEGLLSLPGTLTATSFSTIIDVEEGFGTSPTSGPSPVPSKLPLVYYYGYDTPEGNTAIYRRQISRMALAVSSKLSEDEDAREAGCIIDTSGALATKEGYDMLHHMVAEFSVDTLVVLGSERLYSDMVRKFESGSAGRKTTVVKLPKSGGCVDREDEFLKKTRENQMREYFYGNAKRTLSPYIIQTGYTDLRVWSVGQNSSLASSFLPVGEEATQTLLVRVAEPGPSLQNTVLGVLNAEYGDSEEELAESTCMGFVYVAGVDDERKVYKVLAPVSGRLPQKPMVLGLWPEPTFSLSDSI